MGVMQENTKTREKAGVFEVSHMGQGIITGDDYASAAVSLETLIPVDIRDLQKDRQRYGFFTNDAGGIMDDLMIANRGDHIFVVVNAACKAADIAHMKAKLDGVRVREITDRALLALPGPAAEAVLATLNPKAADMRFLAAATPLLGHAARWVARSRPPGDAGL